jgi:hypothetical protein
MKFDEICNLVLEGRTGTSSLLWSISPDALKMDTITPGSIESRLADYFEVEPALGNEIKEKIYDILVQDWMKENEETGAKLPKTRLMKAAAEKFTNIIKDEFLVKYVPGVGPTEEEEGEAIMKAVDSMDDGPVGSSFKDGPSDWEQLGRTRRS